MVLKYGSDLKRNKGEKCRQGIIVMQYQYYAISNNEPLGKSYT